MMDTQLPRREGNYLYAIVVISVAAVGGFLFGYDLVIIAGAQLFLRSEFSLSDAQWGFATSSAVLGCIAGPFLGASLCDRWGRRNVLCFSALLFGGSAIGTALPQDITTFNVFRILGGVGVGLASIASPMYITEIAPAKRRGSMGMLYQLAIVIGCTAAVAVSYFMAKHLSEQTSWRWMFASEIVPIALFVVLLCFVPKSPRWLAERGHTEEALAVLTKINGQRQARIEIDEIEASLSEETGNWSELFQPGIRKALLIGILLAVFCESTGWSVIAYYMPTLFQMAGYEDKSEAIFQTLIINGITVLLTIIAIMLVDRLGRRPLWIVTSAAMIFSLTLTGIGFQFGVSGGFVLFLIFMCAWPHCIGLGPLPWLMMSEIQPTRIRAKAVAISTTFLWITAFIGPMLFPFIKTWSEELFGSMIGLFLLFAVISVGALIFGLRMLPETKGKTLEEIAEGWLSKR